jgi:hypothetical protein
MTNDQPEVAQGELKRELVIREKVTTAHHSMKMIKLSW